MRMSLRALIIVPGVILFASCSGSSTDVPVDTPEEPEPFEVGVLDRSSIPPYPEELELKVSCYTASDGDFTAECPVLTRDDLTYWALSHIDNRLGMTILAFDEQGEMVGDWEHTGARYLWQITVDEVAETVTFWGQGAGTFEVSWDELEI